MDVTEKDEATPEARLQQGDIDKLLGMDEKADRPGAVMEEIANSTIVNYERLPMLDVITDRLVRSLSDDLRQLMSSNVAVETRDIRSVRFGDFIGSVGIPCTIAILKAQEWDGSCMAVVDQELAYAMVDILMGGQETRTDFVECRPMTSIERRLVGRVMGVLARDLGAAFEGLTQVTFSLDRLETNPQLAQISRGTNVAVQTQLWVDVDGRGGTIDLVLPYSTLEPVRPMLTQVFMGEKFGRDEVWREHFHSAIMRMEIDLAAVLHESRLSLAETMQWRRGTCLTLDLSPDSTTRLVAAGQDLFAGKMGQRNGRVAVRIDQVTFDAQDSQAGKDRS